MELSETIQIILILMLFLTLFVPVVMGIIYYARENRRLDREARQRGEKAAAQEA
jgi:hypothetical protein